MSQSSWNTHSCVIIMRKHIILFYFIILYYLKYRNDVGSMWGNKRRLRNVLPTWFVLNTDSISVFVIHITHGILHYYIIIPFWCRIFDCHMCIIISVYTILYDERKNCQKTVICQKSHLGPHYCTHYNICTKLLQKQENWY